MKLMYLFLLISTPVWAFTPEQTQALNNAKRRISEGEGMWILTVSTPSGNSMVQSNAVQCEVALDIARKMNGVNANCISPKGTVFWANGDATTH